MSNPTLETRALRKTFSGGVTALDRLDMAVPSGAVYGLIGRNGAGKTTAIRALMGLLHADSGTAHILGQNLWKAPRELKARIGYVSQVHRLHGWMTLEELGRYVSHFYDRWSPETASRLAKRFELDTDRPVGVMSGGQQRLAAAVLAVAAGPQVLVLDEPAAGLDPLSRRRLMEELIDFISDAATSGRTVLFSTHILADLERVADHIGIMDRGKMLAQGRLEDFQSRTRRVQIVFDTPIPPPDFSLPGAVRIKTEGPVVTAIVRSEREDDFRALHNIPHARVNLFPLGLEELFIELLGPQGSAELTQTEAS